MKKAWIGFFVVISFLALFLAPTAGKAQSVNQLKILTLNFNAETNNEVLKWKRFPIFENYIKQNNIDVVFIQECWNLDKYISMSIKLAEDLNMDAVFQMENGVAGIRATSLCMVVKKDLQLRNVKKFKLPHSAPTLGNGQTTWIALGEVDTLLGGTITLRNGQTAFLWTAHLNGNSESKRSDQMKFSAAQIKETAQAAGESWESARIIFGGDFNVAEGSPEANYLTQQNGFRDIWTLAHPEDPGHTLVDDIHDPEYNPLVHGAGLFPSQFAPQGTARIDQIYGRFPQTVGVVTGRIFTSPIDGVWMSDHYGLAATFDFSGSALPQTPSADSNMAALGPPTIFSLTDENLAFLPNQKDFDVTSARGFTLYNDPNVSVEFFFTSNKGQVYPVSSVGIGTRETASFVFFTPGNYKYRMIIRDYRRDGPGSFPDFSKEPQVKEMDGVVQVH